MLIVVSCVPAEKSRLEFRVPDELIRHPFSFHLAAKHRDVARSAARVAPGQSRQLFLSLRKMLRGDHAAAGKAELEFGRHGAGPLGSEVFHVGKKLEFLIHAQSIETGDDFNYPRAEGVG
jgi:hypothetical protein